MERDFKGVWIPAEIWLNEELSMLDKVLYTEISSLDNEEHCTAGNEYFANFCGYSERAITNSIKKLKELGMIEELKFNGRCRKLAVVEKFSMVKMTRQHGQNDEAASSKRRSINIANNPNSKNAISIINNTNNKKSLVKKKSMYEKMQDEIHVFTKGIKVQKALEQFLKLQLEIYRDKGKTYYSNIFKSRLNKLKDEFDEKDWLKIITAANENGWQNFYPLKDNKPAKKKRACDEGVSCDKWTDEELKEIEKWQKEQIAKGERITF